MGLVYATQADLVAYTPAKHVDRIPGEPEASRLLAIASKEVLLATRTAVYDTDSDGYPTNTDVRAALRDATCAQALWWMINPDEETGIADEYDSVSIGSVRLTKKTTSGGRQAGLPVGGSGRLAAMAATELAVAGLTPGHVNTVALWRW